ncbi:class I SAM-dependent methyltransferase [Brevibacillus fortis]
MGYGGGIYTKALIEIEASHVTGVDFSDAMLKRAANN